LDTDEKVKQKE